MAKNMLSKADEVLVVACMKDEGPFLLEWLAYYLSIGVGRFIIVSNDCSDGTDFMLDRLDELGLVRHLPNPIMIEPYKKPIQNVALKYAALQREFREAGWVLVVDADEFLNIRVGNNDLPSLFEHLPDFDAISFNQVVFGNRGVEAFEDKPIARQFDYRFQFESDPQQYPMMFGLKTLSRNSDALFSQVSNHLPRLKAKATKQVRWFDGGGREMHPDFLDSQPRSYPVFMDRQKDDKGKVTRQRRMFDVTTSTHDVGYVNHYSLRSLESFIMQSLRGDAVTAQVRRDAKYWRSYDRNHVRDTSINAQSFKSDAIREELLSDIVLRKLHDEAVAHHRATFLQIAKKPVIQKLLAECRASMTTPGEI